jgi:hypothetical protein
MKKLILAISLFLIILTGCASKQVAEDPKEVKKYTVVETFKLVDFDEDGIRGDLLTSTDGGMGEEGIFLDYDTVEDFDLTVEDGDEISVTYDKEDYDNGIWDNILEIEEL